VPGIDAPIPLPETIDLPEGAAIALAVRPEKLRLRVRRPEGIALAAVVSSINYQGGVSMVHLTATSGQTLKAQMPSAEAAAYSRGAQAWASWDAADAVLITR
jgi:ABC-type Fe3+/spermidine/putrescine transport system ATPase subunit